MNNPFEILNSRLSNIENILHDINHKTKSEKLLSDVDNPLDIKKAAKLIGKTVPTLYGYCQRNEMPYIKNGNRLIFFKSEIIAWLKEGKQKTLKELEADADAYLSNKNKGLK